MSHQVSIIWSNLLQKAIWGEERFHRVAESIKSLQSLHHQTSQSLKSAQDHNRCIDEWLNGVGFRPFQQMRAQEMEEQWEVVESGSKKIEGELSDIQDKSRSLRTFLEQVERALQSKSISSADRDHLSGHLKEFSDALLALDRHLKSVHALQESSQNLHIRTQELYQSVQQDQNILDELSSSIESVQEDL